MADLVLPHDILREIGAHWAGHRLLYTCTALYVCWRPDDHVITREIHEEESQFGKTVKECTTIKCMPNGVHHGKCTTVWRRSPPDILCTEIIEYDRGQIVLVTYNGDNGLCVVSAAVDGRVCRWASATHMTWASDTGCVSVPTAHIAYARRVKVAFCDFIPVARKMLEGLPRSDEYPRIDLMLRWIEPMPGASH